MGISTGNNGFGSWNAGSSDADYQQEFRRKSE